MGKLKFSWFCVMLLVTSSVHAEDDDDAYNETMFSLSSSPSPAPAQAPASGEERQTFVPALFAFGDSLIDNGNNNNLFSFAKANYFPYGIDVGGPTGRFSNGYTIVDQIGDLLGLPLLPPYSEMFNVDKMRFGVNYASAAAGILDITGFHFVGRIPLSSQVRNFENTLMSLKKNLSASAVEEAIPKCIFFMGMGSNDYLNNYMMPFAYFSQDQYTPQKFAELLIHNYIPQLKKLYDLGGRKFIISGIGQMGCIPSMLAQSTNGECLDIVNKIVHPFNSKLKAMSIKLNNTLPGAHFIFLDMENMFKHILTNHNSYGFSVTDRGCCGLGSHGGEITCLPMATPCENRDDYLFWDAYHPTSAVNLLLGSMAFYGVSQFAYPINIQQLASL